MKRRYIYENTNFTVDDILSLIANFNETAAEEIGSKYSEVLQYYVDHNWESAQGAAENIYYCYTNGFEPSLCLQMAKEVNRLYTGDEITENTKKSKRKYSDDDYEDMQELADEWNDIIE